MVQILNEHFAFLCSIFNTHYSMHTNKKEPHLLRFGALHKPPFSTSPFERSKKLIVLSSRSSSSSSFYCYASCYRICPLIFPPPFSFVCAFTYTWSFTSMVFNESRRKVFLGTLKSARLLARKILTGPFTPATPR
jgi:hypothetical protein